jgi:hypothetical protein
MPVAPALPSPTEIRAASLNWAFSNRKARRELRWTPSPHEDCLEATVSWWQQRDGEALARTGTRQPIALRAAGALARRLPF